MFINFGIGSPPPTKDLEKFHPDFSECHILSEAREHKEKSKLKVIFFFNLFKAVLKCS